MDCATAYSAYAWSRAGYCHLTSSPQKISLPEDLVLALVFILQCCHCCCCRYLPVWTDSSFLKQLFPFPPHSYLSSLTLFGIINSPYRMMLIILPLLSWTFVGFRVWFLPTVFLRLSSWFWIGIFLIGLISLSTVFKRINLGKYIYKLAYLVK